MPITPEQLGQVDSVRESVAELQAAVGRMRTLLGELARFVSPENPMNTVDESGNVTNHDWAAIVARYLPIFQNIKVDIQNAILELP